MEQSILDALGIKQGDFKRKSYGFASMYQLKTPTQQFFLKVGSTPESETMLRGEYESLVAVHNVCPDLCPEPIKFTKADNYWVLQTEYLDFSGSMSRSDLAKKLGKLHSTPAPIPEGYDSPQYGFPVPTCCGSTVQVNDYCPSWSEFFAKNRLEAILRECEKNNGKDPRLRKCVETVVSKVVPRLLDELDIQPVVVHGDLWSGNASSCTSKGAVIYDIGSCYAHSEYDLGIMNMFGGFGPAFFKEYHQIVPKTKPEAEYSDRVALYEAYHHLNHHALFGGYKSGAMRILQGLIDKYDD